MRILVADPTYLPARRANTIQVMKMCQAICELGHTVELLVPSAQKESPPSWAELAEHYGLSRQFPISWLNIKPGLRSYDFGMQVALRAKQQSLDLLYTRHPQAAATASLMNVPTLLEMHDIPHGITGKLLMRMFLRGKGARRLVVITHALKQSLYQSGILPHNENFVIVLPDGVDLQRFENLPEPKEARHMLEQQIPQLHEKKFVAGFSGQLYAGRGTDLILSMAAALPEMMFLIVGGEPLAVEQLRLQAIKEGIHNLILTGFIPNSKLPLYQSACDALLMPYQRHVAASSGGDIGQFLSPMKLFEYMACGRAILASDLPVFREILHPGNALLLSPNDASAWVDALKSLQDQPQLGKTLGAQARSECKAYDWSLRSAKMLDNLF